MHGVLDTGLLLFELGLGGRADLDQGDAADHLGQPFLELLAVVIRRGLVDLRADLLDPGLDVGGFAFALDDRGVVLVDDDLLGLTQPVEPDGLELDADVLGDDPAAGQDADVLEHGLAAVSETGRLDGRADERALELVDDQCRQGFALDFLGDDQEGTSPPGHVLEQGQEVLEVRDFLLVKKDDRVLQDDLHPLGVGDEIG